MLISPNLEKYIKRIIYSYTLLLLSGISVFLNSCTAPVTDNGEYSKEFKPILDTVTYYYGLGANPKKGLNYLDSTFKLIKHPFSNDWHRYYGFHFLYYRRTVNDRKKTLLYADTMLMTAKRSVNQTEYKNNFADASFANGDAYADLQQYDDAYRFYYQGFSIGRSTIDDAILAEYTYRMGMVLFKQGNYRQAAGYFKLSYQQSKGYKDDFKAFYQRQEVLDDIGESYKNSGDVDSAQYFFTKALNFINGSNQRFKIVANMLEVARGVVYGNQGDLALITHDYPNAEILLKKSIAINGRKGNDNYDAELTQVKLARLYLATNKYEDLFSTLKNLRTQMDSVHNDEAEISWNHFMSVYYLHNKDYSRSLNYLRKFSLLKDSALIKSSSLKQTNVTQQQASFDKQGQIQNLKDNNKIQLIYIYLAVVFSILSVIIIFLVFRNLKRSRQDIIAVRSLNDKINKQKANLETTLEELYVSEREKDRILRAVAHDLRNPLGGIASLSELMAKDQYKGDQLEMINLIKETSFNSLELINEILEAADTATAKFNKEWVEINALLSNSVELLRFKAAEKEQIIVLDLLVDLKELFINREKIWRVMSNLISNAIKFSQPGKTINVSIENRDQGIEIAVKDNGIGIPDKLKQQVFNMFTDAKRPGTIGEKSFGLGLSICRQIIEKHQGRIWLQSDVGSGTTFFVYLPVSPDDID